MARQGSDSQADLVRAAADELYGLPLDEFTAARKERAIKARKQGDADAAAAIGKLAKPNTVAWLANQLAREHAAELQPLLDLGDSMRQATAALDTEQLRQLSRQQHQVVSALVRQAHRLASAAGHAFSDSSARSLEDTLHAAMADEQAAAALAEGRLTSGLSHSGFPGMAGTQAFAPPRAAPDRRPGPSKTEPADQAAAQRQQLKRAREAEAAARSGAADAGQALEQARAELTEAERAAGEAAERVEAIRAELGAAVTAQANADRAARQARKTVELAERVTRQAVARLEEATSRRVGAES